MTVLDILLEQHAIRDDQAEKITRLAVATGLPLIKLILNYGFLTRKDYGIAMEKRGYSMSRIREEPIDKDILRKFNLEFADRHLVLPLRIAGDRILLAMADPTDQESIRYITTLYQKPVEILTANDLDIVWLAHVHLGEKQVKDAVFSLLRKDPEASAIITFTTSQLVIICLLLAILVSGMVLRFRDTAILMNILISTFFLVAIIFKLYLSLKGSQFELHQPVERKEMASLKNDDLPVYTILLPVYKESDLIKKLIWNLQSLDYPMEKLDVKLLIEEDDSMTLQAVQDLDFPAVFEVIIVPYHLPKTKPKACNYGLHFSRGEFLTIYDAEDLPDSDQLKKVVTLFRKLPDKYICVQCALNYFNRGENFLTRMFTLEYSYWFDYMLPGLDTLDIPIPLGGTSNHFRTFNLRELGAWDPFNVTEDADLGLRAYARGFKVTVANSTTYEEANNAFFNWIRQRSRWIKGYMQTYLVHMRHPLKLLRRIGFRGFLGFQFFIGAPSLTFLIYPILLIIFLIYLVFDMQALRSFFPDWVNYLAIGNFIAGNVLMIYVNMLAVFKRRLYDLIIFAVLNPIYWIMHSIAAYKGLWQLVTRPFYWEKTNHGLSKMMNIHSGE